jgi:hypothetical protein
MRITPSLLCFFLLFSVAPAADWAPTPAPAAAPSAIDTYISARDRAISALSTDPPGDAKANDTALADLERKLRPLIPAWTSPGFGDGTITLVTLLKDDIGFGQLDGFEYQSRETKVVVTTKPFLTRWMADHKKWWDDQPNIPASTTAAFRTDAFYTQAIGAEDTVYLHGLVLVQRPADADLAVAELAAFSGDTPMDRGPDRLVAVVMRGETIFIAREPLKEKLAPVPFCQKAMQQMLARAKAEKDTKKSDALEEQADREYRACFAQRLREQPNYAAIQKQAQALVDLLH